VALFESSDVETGVKADEAVNMCIIVKNHQDGVLSTFEQLEPASSTLEGGYQ
jgi:hypothetical protein